MIVQTDGQTKATFMSLDSVNWLIYVNIIAVLVFNLDLYNNLSISQMMEEIICFFNNSLALRVHQSLKKTLFEYFWNMSTFRFSNREMWLLLEILFQNG